MAYYFLYYLSIKHFLRKRFLFSLKRLRFPEDTVRNLFSTLSHIYWAARIMIYCTLHRVNRVLGLFSEFGLPHPLTRRRVCPPPLGPGGHTRLRERGRGRGFPIRSWDRHCGNLGIYVLCGSLEPWDRCRAEHQCHCNCKVVTSWRITIAMIVIIATHCHWTLIYWTECMLSFMSHAYCLKSWHNVCKQGASVIIDVNSTKVSPFVQCIIYNFSQWQQTVQHDFA